MNFYIGLYILLAKDGKRPPEQHRVNIGECETDADAEKLFWIHLGKATTTSHVYASPTLWKNREDVWRAVEMCWVDTTDTPALVGRCLG